MKQAVAFAVHEYDDLAVDRLAWPTDDDTGCLLDQACDVCLSYTDLDLGIDGKDGVAGSAPAGLHTKP